MKYEYYKIHLKIPDAEKQKCNYVGMTTNFNVRKAHHKSACNNENDKNYNYPVYQHIRANGGWGAWCVEPLEIGEYETRLEASKRERYWYELEGGELNYCVPARELKEYMAGYYDIKKDEIQEKNKEYRAANKDKIREHNKKYKTANKDKIQQQQKQIYEENKEQRIQYQKEYNSANKEHIQQRQKEYRAANKEHIQQQKKEYYQQKKAAQN
jgi:hypothetical protein